MNKVKQFNNAREMKEYLENKAEPGEVVELNEAADCTHPKRITRYVNKK